MATTGLMSGDMGSYGFKSIPHITLYHEGARANFEVKSFERAIDARPQLKSMYEPELKALTTTSGGAGTAGYAMVPIYVDPRITDVSRKYTPLVELFPRVTNLGTTADFNIITSKGGATTFLEDSSLTETNTTYDRVSVAIKYIYAVGRVTGQGMAAIPPYSLEGFVPTGGAVGAFNPLAAPNAKQLEVLVKTREIKEKEEDLIVRGNATTSASLHGVTGANGTEFNGIIAWQSTTNMTNKSSTALTLDDLNTSIQAAFDDGGRPNLGVCNSAVYNDLLKLLTAKIGYLNPTEEVFWGFSSIVINTMVGKIPIIPTMFIPNTANLGMLFFLDMTVWELRVLQDLTYQELAKTSDAEKFFLKMYECLICKNTAFNSGIYGITS